MKESFDKIAQAHFEFKKILESAMVLFPDSVKHYKLKKQLESAHRKLIQALKNHENLVTDSVPAIKVKTDGYKKEFIDVWNVYKDYMVEQFGKRMGSRMQTYRLKLLFELTENDFTKASKWLEFYMASGSANIFPVNDFNLEQNGTKEEKTDKKPGFQFPTPKST